jgi:NAD-reducing hydrogenase large subunit
MTRVVLDAVLDPFTARVLVSRAADGRVGDARFDLAGLPRVDALLAGRPVREVPSLVERLCGVCPVAHHLAGVQALEALYRVGALPPAATAIRRLLHHGSVLSVHAGRFVITGSDDAIVLRRFAKLAMAAAGSPGHFPVTAVVGGVAAPAAPQAVAQVRAALPEARGAASRLVRAAFAGPARPDRFEGADVALTDPEGRPDLLGARLRAVSADGGVVIAGAAPAEWDALVAESVPGDPAPRPYLKALGPDRGRYRVGPLAQLRAGPLATPRAAEFQDEWRGGGNAGGATGARAVMALHCVEAVGALLDAVGGADAEVVVANAGVIGEAPPPAGVGVGWADGARGLLVHRYAVSSTGALASAQILTPTAQNEPWLAELLRRAVAGAPDGPVPAGAEAEDAIREADPCLPCAAAPPGKMGLLIETVPDGPPAASGGQ